MPHDVPLPRTKPGVGLVLLALALLAFAMLARDLLVHGPITRADVGISIWMHGRTHPALTVAMVAISHAHSTLGICTMAAIAAAVLSWRKQLAWLSLLLASVPGGVVLNGIVKLAFHRTRPVFDGGTPLLATFSFPSGHTAGATVWWGFALAFWCACEPRPRWRAGAAVFAALMIALTAVSRVYLGFHYTSDVLAAVAEGAAWLALCFTAASALRRGHAVSEGTDA